MKTKRLSKKTLFFSAILAFVITFYQCDFINSFLDEKDGKSVDEESYICTNTTDPEFVKYVSDEGEIVNVFGTRDANGYPKLVTQINVTTSKGEFYSFMYNDQKQLTTAIADNGTIINYDWISSTKVALNIVFNDGVNQFNTELGLDEINSYKSTKINWDAPKRSDFETCSDMEFTPFVEEEQVSLQAPNFKLVKMSGGTVHHIYVTTCGAPDWQTPYLVEIYDQSGSVKLKDLAVETLGKGHYTVTVPSGTAPTLEPQAMIKELTSVLSLYCDAAGLAGASLSPAACAAIAAKLSMTGIGVTAGATFGTACAGITAALAVYCNTLGASGPPGSSSLIDKIDFKLVGGMRLYVSFHALPKKIVKGFNISEGVPSEINVELGENSNPSIRSIELSPSAPAAKQSYMVSVSVFCAPVGSTVAIAMVGTDGYTKQTSYTISDVNEASGKFTMSVPGGSSGVRDEITASLSTPDGNTVTRSASLVFGE